MDAFYESVAYAIVAIPLVAIAVSLMKKYWRERLDTLRAANFAKFKYILLEIKIPRELDRGPAAMESVLNYLHQTGGESTWYDVRFLGKTRPWFSFEICAIDGRVHFFIWTREVWRKHVERSIYAQYPTVEISEVDDYTFGWDYDPTTIEAWGIHQTLAKPDAYPIKTYVDYGLDKADQEESNKIDPFSNLIEMLGSFGKDEQLWVQILVRGHKKIGSSDSWEDAAKSEIDKIIKSRKETGFQLTKEDNETITALRRSISKPGFDCGIRILHFAKKEAFNGMNNPALIGMFKMFNSGSLNGFKPAGGMTVFDYWWQDRSGKKAYGVKKDLFAWYKQRSFFYLPHASSDDVKSNFKELIKKTFPILEKNWFVKSHEGGDPFVLNTEELATIFHFPTGTTQTPTFERVQSRKAEAPANLPF
jgi:hypothetical protein